MREAVGGTFLFNIVIIFIFFFASFLAIAINYSQAFRIKNQVINLIEQYEGIDESKEEIVDYIISSGYYREKTCDSDSTGERVSYNAKEAKGLCVKKMENRNGDIYYKVTTYVSFDLPIIGNFFSIPVKGETKIILNDN